jgi:hypothetical protein
LDPLLFLINQTSATVSRATGTNFLTATRLGFTVATFLELNLKLL